MQAKPYDHSEDFIELLNSNKGILFKVVRSYWFVEEEQKDLIQEISLQAWRSFPNYNSNYKFSTWLYRAALNVAISTLRKESKRKEINSPFEERLIELKISDEEPIEENVSQLYSAIAELKPFDRAFILRYLDEKPYPEMADIIGISESNVATKLSRLRQVLKEKYLTLNQK